MGTDVEENEGTISTFHNQHDPVGIGDPHRMTPRQGPLQGMQAQMGLIRIFFQLMQDTGHRRPEVGMGTVVTLQLPDERRRRGQGPGHAGSGASNVANRSSADMGLALPARYSASASRTRRRPS